MFKCSKCGQCCRNLDKSALYKNLDRGDGTCRFLQENLCGIYDDRPLLCRVDDSYKVYFKDMYSLEEYYAMNHKCCGEMQSL